VLVLVLVLVLVPVVVQQVMVAQAATSLELCIKPRHMDRVVSGPGLN
jgi:hypothetical protein